MITTLSFDFSPGGMRYDRESTESAAGRLASYSRSAKQVAVQSFSLLTYLGTTCFLIYKLCMTAFLNYPGNRMKHCLWTHFVTFTKLRNAGQYYYAQLNTSHIIIWLCMYELKQWRALLQDLAKRKSIFWLVMHCTGHMMISINDSNIGLQCSLQNSRPS